LKTLKLILSFVSIFVIFSIEAKTFVYKNNINSSNKLRNEYKLIPELYELIIGDIDLAEKKIDSLIKKNKNHHNKAFLVDLYLLQSELHRSKGDFTYMKLSFYQALVFSIGINDQFSKSLVEFYATVNKAVNLNYKQQEQKLKLILNKIKNKNFLFIEARIHQALGKYFSKTKRFRIANEHYEIAQAKFKKIGFENIPFEIEISKGINNYLKGNFSKALQIFHKTRIIAKQKNYEKCYSYSLLNLGEAHLYLSGNEDSAIYYLKKFETLIHNAENRDVLHAYYLLSEYYKKTNQIHKSYYYKDLMYAIDDNIRSKMISHVNREIDEVYKKMQNERNLNEEGNRQKLLKILFGLIGLFFLLIIIVFWYIIKEKGKLNEVLTLQKEEINAKKNQLNFALNEKEILLKEIHHRVKNNLQIISSLLSLQSKNISDENAKQAIFEGKERIQTIALIHKKLYQNDTYASIEMNSYLEDLVNQLKDSYQDLVKNVAIKIETNEIILNLDTVVPLGLIICELVTNSFKYAFKDNEYSKLKISLSLEDDDYLLIVKDNGKGMNETTDFLNSPTLGIEITQALTEQLDGDISYKSNENGTTIKIKFKGIKTKV
jgi:two-component sensor histidine kinase